MATATARKNLLSDPATQRAIAARAANLAKKKIGQAKAEIRERFKRAAPALRKDVLEAFVIPGGAGVAGAIGVDFVLDRFQPLSGAKGDIAKILAGVAVGTAGRKFLRNAPLVHHAALGVVVVNTYKLVTRLVNRAVAGRGLSGLLDDGDNADLAGYWGNTTHLNGLDPVAITLSDGRVISGGQDSNGNVYDESGALLVFEDEQLQGIPYQDVMPPSSRVSLHSGVVVN